MFLFVALAGGLVAPPAHAQPVNFLIDLYGSTNETGTHVEFTQAGTYNLSSVVDSTGTTIDFSRKLESWSNAFGEPASVWDGNTEPPGEIATSGNGAGACMNLDSETDEMDGTVLAPDSATWLVVGSSCPMEVLLYPSKYYGSKTSSNCPSGFGALNGGCEVSYQDRTDYSLPYAGSLGDPVKNVAGNAGVLDWGNLVAPKTAESILMPYGGLAALYSGPDETGQCLEVSSSINDLSTTVIGNDSAQSIQLGVGCDQHGTWEFSNCGLTTTATQPATEISGDNPDLTGNSDCFVSKRTLQTYQGVDYSALQIPLIPYIPIDGTQMSSYSYTDIASGDVAVYTGAGYVNANSVGMPAPDLASAVTTSGSITSIVNPLSTPVAVFAERNYVGACVQIAAQSSLSDLGTTVLGSRAPASIVAATCPSAPEVYLYTPCSGGICAATAVPLTGDVPDLSTYNLGTSVASATNPSPSPIALFTGANYTGTCTAVPPGENVNLSADDIAAGSVYYDRGCPGTPTPITMYVDAAQGSSPWCVGSGAGACATIGDAVDRALLAYGGDAVTIKVPAGDYAESVDIDAASDSPTSLTVQGAGAATTTVGNTSGTVFRVDSQHPVTISDLAIVNGASSSDAGGVEVDSAVTLSRDLISGDSGPTGGVHVAAGGSLVLRDDTITGNSGSAGAGGLSAAGPVTALNDTFFANTSTDGDGAVGLTGGSGTFDYVTFAGNSGTAAADLDVGGSASASVDNSILADTDACGDSALTGSHDVEADDSCDLDGDSTNLVDNPDIDLATSLAANGLAGYVGPDTLALGPDSAAIDLVPAAACGAGFGTESPVDEAGQPRPGVTGQTNCDAGAYEYQHTPGTLTQSGATSDSVAAGTGYAGQLSVTGAAGAVTYDVTSTTSPLSVSSSGAITAPSDITPGNYSASGTDTDRLGDAGTWSFTLTVKQVAITVHVSGQETYDGTPTFTAQVDPPSGVDVTGQVSCTAVLPGHSLSGLRPGGYTLDGTSCSGLTVSDPTDYRLSYTGVADGFVVSRATPAPPAVSNLPAPGEVGAQFTAQVVDATTDDTGVPSVTSSTPAVCTVGTNGLTVTLVTNGTCTLTAHLGADMLYTAVDGAPQSFDVGVPPAFTGAATSTVQFGQDVDVTVTATGVPAPSLTLSPSTPLPTGLSWQAADGTATISGTPASGTEGSYDLHIDAANPAGTAAETFTLVIEPGTAAAPTITNEPAPGYPGGTFVAQVAESSSGDDGAASVTSSTPAVCVVGSDGLTVTLDHAGTCTLTAQVAATVDYTAATGSAQSFTVAKAPTTLHVRSLLLTLFQPSATLVRADTGAPIAGQTVVFSVAGHRVCSATTDGTGVAICHGAFVVTLFRLTATFAGSADYAGTTASAGLLGSLTRPRS